MADYVQPTDPARVPRGSLTPFTGADLEAALEAAPRRSAAHVDGWRWEHLRDLAALDTFHDGLLLYAHAVARVDVPPLVADFLASATLLPFLKRPASVVDGERAAAHAAGQDYTPPTRPISVSSVLVRLVGSCLLCALEGPLQEAASPAQYAFRIKNGVEAVQVGVRVAWEPVLDSVVLHISQ